MEYKIGWPILHKEDFDKFLSNGWRPYGSPFIDNDGDINQALIRG